MRYIFLLGALLIAHICFFTPIVSHLRFLSALEKHTIGAIKLKDKNLPETQEPIRMAFFDKSGDFIACYTVDYAFLAYLTSSNILSFNNQKEG